MKWVRFLFVVAFTTIGYLGFPTLLYSNPILFLLLFLLLPLSISFVEYISLKFNAIFLFSLLASFILSAFATVLIGYLLRALNISISSALISLLFLSLLYLSFSSIYKISRAKLLSLIKPASGIIVMDTSAIIDGRIADLYGTKFISARLLIPRFILRELQQIADSQDPLKRNRGRRGLDILNKMRKAKIDIVIDDRDFPEIRDVDAKLVQLAKLYNAPILTTDYNLNKVAELQGVQVLNINDLANALKPVFLPGESLKIRIVKEGKEYNQGVGYLDDGTMVVVEDARHLIGSVLDVVVTSVLQTSAGRIIFTKRQDQRG